MTDVFQPSASEVGELRGRVIALEGRTDRMETKIDQRLVAIDAKLDVLNQAIATQSGERRALGWMDGWSKMLAASGLGAVGSWLVSHVGLR